VAHGVPGHFPWPTVSRDTSRGPRCPGTLPVSHGVPGHFPWPTVSRAAPEQEQEQQEEQEQQQQ